MDVDEVTVIELLTVQEEHADEAKELVARSVQYFRQIPGCTAPGQFRIGRSLASSPL